MVPYRRASTSPGGLVDLGVRVALSHPAVSDLLLVSHGGVGVSVEAKRLTRLLPCDQHD